MIVDVSLFRRWDFIAMCLAMAVLFVLEMLGVFTKSYVTITAIVRSVPKPFLAMAWDGSGITF